MARAAERSIRLSGVLRQLDLYYIRAPIGKLANDHKEDRSNTRAEDRTQGPRRSPPCPGEAPRVELMKLKARLVLKQSTGPNRNG